VAAEPDAFNNQLEENNSETNIRNELKTSIVSVLLEPKLNVSQMNNVS
jgi:hypothetical protein